MSKRIRHASETTAPHHTASGATRKWLVHGVEVSSSDIGFIEDIQIESSCVVKGAVKGLYNLLDNMVAVTLIVESTVI